MSSGSPIVPPKFSACPSCGTVLKDGAVLCVACGYHLKLGRKLETEHGASLPKPSSNPYAAPSIEATEADPPKKGLPKFDLTERAVKEVEGLVSDAKFVWVAALTTFCCCQLVGPLMFPWYGFRLWRWKKLREQFEELRNPNSFSPHGKLAGDFEEAWLWLVIGMGIGIFYTVLAFIAVIMYLLAQMEMQRQLNNA